MPESTHFINGLIKICENKIAFIKQEFLLEFLETSETTNKPSNNPVTIKIKLSFYKKSNFFDYIHGFTKNSSVENMCINYNKI